jgi:hypothetical protein
LTSGEAAAQAGQEEAELLGFVDTLDFGSYVEDMDARLVGGGGGWAPVV